MSNLTKNLPRSEKVKVLKAKGFTDDEVENILGKERAISLKVSEKGCISMYGLGRFPVTLYYGQWEKVIKTIPALQAFMLEHKAECKIK